MALTTSLEQYTGLFDFDHFAQPKPDGQERSARSVVVIASTTNQFRLNTLLTKWAEPSGLPIRLINEVNGWNQDNEIGADAREKALGKAFHSAQAYRDFIHPDDLTLFIGMDSVNYHNGKMREKPKSFEQFYAFGQEWMELAQKQEAEGVQAGMAVLATHRNSWSYADRQDEFNMFPTSVRSITRLFQPDNYPYGSTVTGGMGVIPATNLDAIRFAEKFTGSVLLHEVRQIPLEEALQRTYAVYPGNLNEIIDDAVAGFALPQISHT